MNEDLIGILSDFINNKQSPDAKASQELISAAVSHQVLPVLYHQTHDKELYRPYLRAISSYTQRKMWLSRIDEILADIPHCTVKGIAVSEYYPVPQLRTMGDCDIIVHESDKEKAKELLLADGFHYREDEWDGREWHFNKQGFDFELHHRLLYEENVNTKLDMAFVDTVWNHVENNELEPNFHFVYVLLHLKKHMLNIGVGFRQFMDLAVMSKYASLDREKLNGYLAQVGLVKFAGVCSALCLRWFGIAFPVDTPEISDEFYAEATETIYKNGVFGFASYDKYDKRVINTIGRKGKLGAILSRFFPSYKSCAGTKKYQWIKGKPYLMPALWVYRIFEFLLSGKSKAAFDYIEETVGSDKELEERNRELEQWGLR